MLFPDGPSKNLRDHAPGNVYVLRDPDTGAIHYVGATHLPRPRWHGHMIAARAALKQGCVTPKDAWILDLLARGKRPVFEIVEHVRIRTPSAEWPPADVDLRRKLAEREQAWIADLSSVSWIRLFNDPEASGLHRRGRS